MSTYQLDPVGNSFTQLLDRVMFDTSLSQGARLTYAALVQHLNRDTGKCCPSQERLASMVGCKARTIRNYLKELTAKGLVTVTKRGYWQSANEYRLNALVAPTTPSESQPVVRADMRNLVGRDIRQGRTYQPYAPTNKSINTWKKRANEAGAVAFMRRELAKQAARN